MATSVESNDKPIRVVIADDHPLVRRGLRELFAHAQRIELVVWSLPAAGVGAIGLHPHSGGTESAAGLSAY